MSVPERQSKNQRREHAREQARLLREKEKARQRRNRFFLQGGIGLAVIAIIAIVAVVIVNSNRPLVTTASGPANMLSDGILLTGSAGATTAVTTAAIKPKAQPVATDASKYSKTANIVEYIDYQCPYCNEFETTNQDQIAQMVANGTATLEIHPIAILDQSSQGTRYSSRAANAAACVAALDPNAFLAVNKALFANQPAEGTTGLSNQKIISIINGAGATGDALSTCINDETYKSWVTAATARALAGPLPNSSVAKVSGTPTVIVSGKQYPGSLTDAATFAAFVAAQTPKS
ncbi:DsbA family protein [Galbitalea soli]|uniref:Thioredoxin domain-containing protein n=1 Tax=Galbitalea soli TaxID=1268042 RepID=A0A7C9TSR5_9MICO|nr:thioredoxin domain-containing protein [Galbitalea soli]NEM91723.1 thioredoxin domain-containing protein [Galbitalea soli]NYJ30419.1 protein-disulfide isomerase [Galbitalea soli]